MQVGMQKTRMESAYAAESIANIARRVKEVLGDVTLIAYGSAVNSMCCGSTQGTPTVSFASFDNNGYYKEGHDAERRKDMRIAEDRELAESKGLFLDGRPESRFMKFFDSITGAEVEIGIPYGRFGKAVENMRAVTGDAGVTFKHTFLGIYSRDLIWHSVRVNSGSGCLLMPSEPHQLYLLHTMWATESYGEYGGAPAEALLRYYKHHYGSMPALMNERHDGFGIGGERYANAMREDIAGMLRKRESQ